MHSVGTTDRGTGDQRIIMTTHTSPKTEANDTSKLFVAWDFARNAALLAGLWLAYAAVRRVTADEWPAAILNAGQVLDFQAWLGLPTEASVQSIVLHNPVLVKILNSFYMWAHFPLTGIFMAWVFFFRRTSFPVIRESLVVLTGAGLLIHLIYPLAPPRILPGIVDTGAVFGPSPYDIGASGGANVIAAMPSLHVGWALIVAISLVSLTSGRWRYLFFLHPIITALVVVVTGNHYWTDAIVAALLVIGAWEFSARLAHHKLLDRIRANRSQMSADPAKTSGLSATAVTSGGTDRLERACRE